MDFFVLGPLVVRDRDEPVRLCPRRRERCLLGLLLLEPGRPVAADRLVDLLWDGDPPAGAEAMLRSHVSRLRGSLSTLSDVRLRRRGAAYLLEVAPDRVDAHRFTVLVRTASQVTGPDRRSRILREALGLWRGNLLADIVSDRLRDRVGEGLTEARLGAAEDLFEAELACGRHDQAVPALTDLVADHPYRERLISLLMLALYRSGRQTDALEVYHRALARLADDLGIAPGPGLRRLHEAVLCRDPEIDPPLTASGSSPLASPVVPAQLPAAPRHFFGREGDLAALAAAGAGAAVVTVEGTAGVGKTALVLRWAAAARRQFPDGQLFVDLRGFSAEALLPPADILAKLLRALGVPGAELPADTATAAARFRAAVGWRRMLILLDNAAGVEQVRPLLPAGPRCVVVITSRNRLADLPAAGKAVRITLGPLPATDAMNLLRAFLGIERMDQSPGAANALSRACGHLPLALRIAAANLADDPGRSIASYLQEAAATGLSAWSVDGDPHAAVRRAFDLSYAKLTSPAARLFRLSGLCPGPTVSMTAAAALVGESVDETRALMRVLADAHLVEAGQPGRYAMHDLIALHARERLSTDEPAAHREAARTRLFGWYLGVLHAAHALLAPHRRTLPVTSPDPPVPPEFPVTWETALTFLDAERPGLVALIRSAAAATMDEAAWQLAYLLGPYFQLRGDGPDSLEIYRIGLGAAQRVGSPSAQAALHNSAGIAYATAHLLPQAAEHLSRAVALFREGGQADAEAGALTNLGRLLAEQHRLPEARAAFERAVRLRTSSGDTARLGFILNNLGGTLAAMGETGQADRCLKRALALHRRNGDLAGEGNTLDTIGALQLTIGAVEEALVSLHTALDVLRAAGYREAEGVTLANLGRAYLRRGDTTAAIGYLRRAADHYDEASDWHRAEQIRRELHALIGGRRHDDAGESGDLDQPGR
jgi:DNA-binding SARP family transcriptional activator/tetratricopeptide (TPR) repeat protein